jgi:hypothetical protein
MRAYRMLFVIALLLGCPVFSRGDIAKRIIPTFVGEFATNAFAKLPSGAVKEGESEFRIRFGFGFLEGFLSPDGAMHERVRGGISYGYQAGQSYRRSFPERLASVLNEYGYVEVDCGGLVSSELVSTGHGRLPRFDPPSDQPPGPWRLDSLGASWPANTGRFFKSRVRVRGFLSPEYDDIGDYRRVLLFTLIERKDG